MPQEQPKIVPSVKGSPNAAAVGAEVVEQVRNGLKVNKGKIIKKHGYADSTSKKPKKITDQPAYKAVVDPFVRKMIVERDAIIALLPKKRGKANFNHLVDGVDKLTKNIQLLTGGDTERDGGIAAHIESLNKLMKSVAKKK